VIDGYIPAIGEVIINFVGIVAPFILHKPDISHSLTSKILFAEREGPATREPCNGIRVFAPQLIQ
jgi:hypothetical protein